MRINRRIHSLRLGLRGTTDGPLCTAQFDTPCAILAVCNPLCRDRSKGNAGSDTTAIAALESVGADKLFISDAGSGTLRVVDVRSAMVATCRNPLLSRVTCFAAIDSARLLCADAGSHTISVVQVEPFSVSVLVGSSFGQSVEGPAIHCRCLGPRTICVGANQCCYFLDRSDRLRRLSGGMVSTVCTDTHVNLRSIAGYFVGTIFFSLLAFRAASVMSQIGSTWADRYFLVLYPLAGLVALQTIHGWLGLPARRWSKLLLGIAVGVSFGIGIMGNLMGLSRIADDKQLIASACQPIWQSDVQVVITDDWWRAEECAADARQTYLLVTDSKLLPALNQTLWHAGIDQFIFASRDGILPLQMLQNSLSQCYKFKLIDNMNDQFGMLLAKVVLEKHQTECPLVNH